MKEPRDSSKIMSHESGDDHINGSTGTLKEEITLETTPDIDLEEENKSMKTDATDLSNEQNNNLRENSAVEEDLHDGTRRAKRPWITPEFMHMVTQRDKLHSQMKHDPKNMSLKKEFVKCRNQTAALRRKLRMTYQRYLEEL